MPVHVHWVGRGRGVDENDSHGVDCSGVDDVESWVEVRLPRDDFGEEAAGEVALVGDAVHGPAVDSCGVRSAADGDRKGCVGIGDRDRKLRHCFSQSVVLAIRVDSCWGGHG